MAVAHGNGAVSLQKGLQGSLSLTCCEDLGSRFQSVNQEKLDRCSAGHLISEPRPANAKNTLYSVLISLRSFGLVVLFLIIFHMYGWFTCMYVCVACACSA